MYFKQITISNIFSYYGNKVFNFPEPENNRNVVLIEGRNGQGKTSFLNAVSLLFLGESNEPLRRKVQRKRLITPKQYVLGDENDEWWGIFNRKARQSEQAKHCYVEASIIDDEQGTIRIKRSWTLLPLDGNYESELEYESFLEGLKTDKDAEEHIQQLLPADLLPFFFFDGEDIQAIAEANSQQTKKRIERLLNISAIEQLRQQNKKRRKAWQSETDDLDLKNKIQNTETDIARLKTNVSSQEQRLNMIAQEIESLESEIKQKQNSLQHYTGQSSEVNLTKVREQLKQQQQKLSAENDLLVQIFEDDFYLRINSHLVDEVMASAESFLNADNDLIESAQEEVKAALRNAPHSNPALEKYQIEFYVSKIVRRLDNLKAEQHAGSDFFIDSSDARVLVKQLVPYQAQQNPAANSYQLLNNIQHSKRQVGDLNEQLSDISMLADGERQLVEQQRQELELLNSELLQIVRDQVTLEGKCAESKNKLKRSEEELGRLYKNIRYSEKLEAQIAVSLAIEICSKEYIDHLKISKRQLFEGNYNQYLSQLLDSNQLISHVEIDDNFALHYKDEQESIVPLSSISAGMKQMSATAMLWALKETSGKSLPIIVDTPMARIDMQHQNNLLTRYYPCAAEQVIILPTDSELDQSKREQILPYISREFRLSNPTGDDSDFEVI